MSFDAHPQDRWESFQCEYCGGNIIRTKSGCYDCDNCAEFSHNHPQNDNDDSVSIGRII